jgi:hypothetical protein
LKNIDKTQHIEKATTKHKAIGINRNQKTQIRCMQINLQHSRTARQLNETNPTGPH